MAVSAELLEILRCPKCLQHAGEKGGEADVGRLELSAAGDALSCAACRLRYRIEDDIPVMLIDEATSF